MLAALIQRLLRLDRFITRIIIIIITITTTIVSCSHKTLTRSLCGADHKVGRQLGAQHTQLLG